jgi:hypothetical protein
MMNEIMRVMRSSDRKRVGINERMRRMRQMRKIKRGELTKIIQSLLMIRIKIVTGRNRCFNANKVSFRIANYRTDRNFVSVLR